MTFRIKDGTVTSKVKIKKDIIPVRLSPNERIMLEDAKQMLEQSKDSTCLKQLATIGSIVIHDKKTKLILKTLFDNKRKNKRLGIIEYEV